jgi:hypothetical protein
VEERKARVKAAMDEIAKLEENTTEKRVTILQNFAKRQAEINATLAADNAKAYANLLKDRKQAQLDAERDIENIRRNSARRLEQIEKTHTQNQYDLLASRDALGLVKEQRRYEDEKKTEQENTAEEIKQRRADLALRLKDLQQSYNDDLIARRQAAAEKQAILIQERDTQIDILRKQKAAEYAIILKNYNDILAILKAAQSGTPTTGSGPKTVTPRAAGGYANDGIYHLGEGGRREFVLDAATTRKAEGRAGGSLNQGNVLGSGMTVNINLGSGGTLTQFRRLVETTKAEIAREFISAIEAA